MESFLQVHHDLDLSQGPFDCESFKVESSSNASNNIQFPKLWSVLLDLQGVSQGRNRNDRLLLARSGPLGLKENGSMTMIGEAVGH
jgi:hypothetical protein